MDGLKHDWDSAKSPRRQRLSQWAMPASRYLHGGCGTTCWPATSSDVIGLDHLRDNELGLYHRQRRSETRPRPRRKRE